MPTYSIDAPNGKTYQIDGPEGATQEEVARAVMAQNPEAGVPESAASHVAQAAVRSAGTLVDAGLQTTFGSSPDAPPAPGTPPPKAPSTVTDFIGTGLHDAAQAAAPTSGMLGPLGPLVRQGAAWLAQEAATHGPSFTQPFFQGESDILSGKKTAADTASTLAAPYVGDYAPPKTTGGKIAETTVEQLPQLLLTEGRSAPALLRGLLASVSGNAASQIAADNGATPEEQNIFGFLGGLGPHAVEAGGRKVAQVGRAAVTAPTTAPTGDAQANAATLDSVGVTNKRQSAVSGDQGQQFVDYQEAQAQNTPRGQAASAQLRSEDAALTNHLNGLITDSGGTVPPKRDETSTAAASRGESLRASQEAASAAAEENVQQAYQQATQQATTAGVRMTESPAVTAFFADPENRNFAGAGVDSQRTFRALQRQHETFLEQNPSPTPAQVETQRQFANSLYPGSDGRSQTIITRYKTALDSDLAAAQPTGQDFFAGARALNAQRADNFQRPYQETLFGTKGNSNQLSTGNEQLPAKTLALPTESLQHTITNLQNAGPAGVAGINALKQEFLQQLRDQALPTAVDGRWNAAAVSQYLAENDAKMRLLFNQQEIARLTNLNNAGQLLRVPTKYPGSAAQGQALVEAARQLPFARRIIAHGAPLAAAGAVAHLAVPAMGPELGLGAAGVAHQTVKSMVDRSNQRYQGEAYGRQRTFSGATPPPVPLPGLQARARAAQVRRAVATPVPIPRLSNAQIAALVAQMRQKNNGNN